MSDDLVTSDVPLTDEVRAFLDATARMYAAGDDDALVDAWFAPDFVSDDHRPLGGGVTTRHEEFRQYLRKTRELLPDFRIAIHVLALQDSTYLARDTYDGRTTEGGGEALIQWWVVDELRDGLLAREDIFETEAEARAEYERRAAA